MSFRKPFRAAELRDRRGNVIPFRQSPRRKSKSTSPMRTTGFIVLAASVFLIGMGVTLLVDGDILEPDAPEKLAAPQASASDTLSARFTSCDGPSRVNCVVDGDTFWLAGDKIRILDINTPETSSPSCDREYALGKQATARLTELLNAGPFSLESGPEDTDRYGRLLRRVTRGGQSLGEILIDEGLAERWRGYKGNWC